MKQADLENIAETILSNLAADRKVFFQNCVDLLRAIKDPIPGNTPRCTPRIELEILIFQLFIVSAFLSEKQYLDPSDAKMLSGFLWRERYRFTSIIEADRLAKNYLAANIKDTELIVEFYFGLQGAIHYENPDSELGVPTLTSSLGESRFLLDMTARKLILASRTAIALAFDDKVALLKLRQELSEEIDRIKKLLG